MMNNTVNNKLLTIAIPSYNSQDYLNHAVETLLTGGDEVEILIIDDGSTDSTPQLADELEAGHPGIIRAIHQPNKGHGGAVMTGIREASAPYFKVVDSDDWVDEKALGKILGALRGFVQAPDPVDLVVANFIYDKAGARFKKVMKYANALPRETVISWDKARHFRKGQYILMHSVIYRTKLLMSCGMELPEHTFYVDNLFVYVPMAKVRSIYYMDVNLYHYFIGREDQSVQEKTMIKRIDQQIRVNKLMIEQVDLKTIADKHKKQYMFNYLEIVTTISSILLLKSGTPEHMEKKRELWSFIRERDPHVYKKLRFGGFGIILNLPGQPGRYFAILCYKIAQKLFGFN